MGVEDACGKKFSYYERMKAFKDSDKEGIQKKIHDVFGCADSFNNVVGSATVQADSSRLSISLLLWMEAIFICLSIPVHAASCAVGFVLGMIVMLTWRICSICSKKAHLQYLNFVKEKYEFEIQIFLINVLEFAFYFEAISCFIGIGILMMLPVSMMLCSIWVCLKVPAASISEMESPASGPSAAGLDFISVTIITETNNK